MESWRLAWRNGFAPEFEIESILALADGLAQDDPTITQGSTTTPPPLMCVQDWPCEAADAIGYAGWKGWGLNTVGEVEEYFATKCFAADQRMGEPAACRWFLNWFDDTPRDEMRRELLAEVRRELAGRTGGLAGLVPREFAAAYFIHPDDTTLLGAIADKLREDGDETAAHAWDCERTRVTEAQNGTPS